MDVHQITTDHTRHSSRRLLSTHTVLVQLHITDVLSHSHDSQQQPSLGA